MLRSVPTRRAPQWLLWAVLVAHVMGIDWLAHHTTGRSLLQAMVEPEFNQPLAVQGTPNASEAAGLAVVDSAVTPTVGQVVQARTLVAAPAPTAEAPTALKVAQSPSHLASPKPKPENRATAPLASGDVTSLGNAAPTEPQGYGDNLASRDAADFADASQGKAITLADQPERDDSLPPAAHPPALTPAVVAAAAPAQPLDDPATWLATWPRSTRLNYQLKGYFRGDLFGHARVQWQRSAQRYQAHIYVNVGLLVDVRMTSQGRITATRLWPEAYEEERRGKKRSARFGDQLVTLDNGTTLNRVPHLQDTASQFVQLAQDFATKRLPLQVGTVIPVTLGRPGGVDEWMYDVLAIETVATALGNLPAYHLKPRPLPNPRGTVSAEIWFAPSLQHLPVRIKLTLNPETWLDLTLDSVAQSD